MYENGPLAPDDRLLQEALIRAGVATQVVPWEASWEPASTDLALVRSTWNYYTYPSQFFRWAASVARRTMLLNPLPVLRWNAHKQYLACLAHQGVPIIPTIFLPRHASFHLPSLLRETGWPQAVLKPCIGANSYGTCLVTQETMTEALVHLLRFSRHDMMLQPYLRTIEDEPEHSHVFVEGVWSHAFVRTPFRQRSAHDAPQEPQVVPTPSEILLAQQVLDALHRLLQIPPLLTARVDLVRDECGVLRVMEVECIEPMLHLEYAQALPRLTENIVKRLATQQRTLVGTRSTW
jgi:glutathione synthase/RimK-type ligase-like ATP-grasp enzyme